MTWSKTPPTVSGLWWYSHRGKVAPEIVKVVVSSPDYIWYFPIQRVYEAGRHHPAIIVDGLFWSEPIQPPTGAGGATHAD